MPQSIDRGHVRQLPRAEHEWVHLEGAIHLRLKGSGIDQVAQVWDRTLLGLLERNTAESTLEEADDVDR